MFFSTVTKIQLGDAGCHSSSDAGPVDHPECGKEIDVEAVRDQ